MEFIEFNKEQILRLPSDINDLYKMCHIFESEKKNIIININEIIFQLKNKTSLIGIDGVIPKNLPIEAEFESDSQQLKTDFEVNRVDIINQQIEKLHEIFTIYESPLFKGELTDEVIEAIKLLLFSENMYMVFYGQAKVKFHKGSIRFETSEYQYQNHFKTKWFSNFLETSSQLANISMFNFMPDDIPIKEAKSFLEAMSNNFMDKTFSIHSSHLSEKLTKTDGFKMMRLICDVLSVLLYSKIKLKRNHINITDLNSIGISSNDVSILKKLSASLLATDRMFYFYGDKISLINPSVTIQSRELIKHFIKINKKENFDKVIGKHFEKSYISDHIKDFLNENGERFQLHGEILSDRDVSGEKKGDIDLIIEDTVARRFIFIQAKYIRNAGKAFIRGDAEYLIKDKVYDGMSQLSEMKKYHINGKLINVLESKKIPHCTPENTLYIFVTNISNLDFQKDHETGVVCYEWNSLRNMLLDGRCTYGLSNDPENHKEWRHHSPLPLEEPSKVIDILMKNSPSFQRPEVKSILSSKHLTTSFTINGVLCKSKGLGL